MLLRNAAIALALVAFALVCAASGASAATKKAEVPVFASIPFSFGGKAVNGSLPNNDALFFLNATAGATGLIQVELEVTSGKVSLEACPVEICFRTAAVVNGRLPVRANAGVANGGQPWLLLANGEASDAVPWWFWVSNVQPNAPAAGSLHITLLETVVVNGTSDSVALSLAAGEFRLIKVEGVAGAGAALKVSFPAAQSSTFQFFEPSDLVLPSNLQLASAAPGYAFDESLGFTSIFQLVVDENTPIVTPSPPTPELSGTYYLAENGGTDGLTWWLVAGSRNQQPTNTTLSFTRVVTTILSNNAVGSAILSERSQIAVYKLPAVAGASGHVLANASWIEPDTTNSTIEAVISAGLIGVNMQLQNGVAPLSLQASSESAASHCLWDDSTTDWWVVAWASDTNNTLPATTVGVQLRQLASLTPSNGAVTFELKPAEFESERLIRVPGTPGGVALRTRSFDVSPGYTIDYISGAVNPESGLPGTICPSSYDDKPWFIGDSTSDNDLSRTRLSFASHEGLDWYILIKTTGPTSSTGTLLFEHVVASSLTLGAAQEVTLFGGELTSGLDVAVFRVDPTNATAAAGLDVSYTINRNSSDLFPGQATGNDNVPIYADDVLSVLVTNDIVVPIGQASGLWDPDVDWAYDVAYNYATRTTSVSSMPLSADVTQVTASGRYWTDESNLLYTTAPQTLNATERTALAVAYRRGVVASANAVVSRTVADDSQQRNWYIVVLGNVLGSLSNYGLERNFTLPLTLKASRAAVTTLQSGVPVLSPPSPQTPSSGIDLDVPATLAQLYRLPSSGAGTSGLVSVTTSGSGCDETFASVSPAARITTGLGQGYGFTSTPSPNFDKDGPYALTLPSSGATIATFGNPIWTRTLLLSEAGAGTKQNIRYAWLQAGDNTDDVDWYVTMVTTVDTTACSFVVTLHDTVLFEDNPVDEFGSLRWTASGVPVTPLSQTLFRLPGRLAQRGLINFIDVTNDDTGASLSVDDGPLALTLQAQTVPTPRAGLGSAYADNLDSQITTGQLFTLPFVPITRSVGSTKDYSYSTLTFGTSGGAFVGSQTGTNNDRSDVYLLGVSRANATTGTQVVEVVIGVAGTRAFCNDKVTCNGKGKCLSDGSCDCKSGYGGQFCSCRDKRDCSGHGICGLTQGCICDSGYSGADCSRSGAQAVAVVSLLAVVLVAIFAALL